MLLDSTLEQPDNSIAVIVITLIILNIVIIFIPQISKKPHGVHHMRLFYLYLIALFRNKEYYYLEQDIFHQ
ncbi:hypothetical protein AWJ19_18980 [Paenibacillus sp. DMB5]|nr:hypothetical protein AWJ19_18980 [Paenibacillus sp. DMB5]